MDPLQLLTLLSRHDFIKGWDRSGIWQKRRPGSEFVGKRIPGSEFLGKRSGPASKRVPGSEFLGKRAPGSEFLGKRAPGSEFLGKRAPGSEFLGKRAPGSEFLGKRWGSPSSFRPVGKRVPGSEFLGKRAPGSEFVGKREDPEEELDEGVKIFKRSPELASPLMQSDRENHLSKSAVAAILAQEALEELDQN